MSPEAFGGLSHSDRDLVAAHHNLEELPEVSAARSYLAAFHAAQAFIFDRSGRVAKTHAGVQTEFSRLAKAERGAPAWLLKFLGKNYSYKQTADYGPDPTTISREQAIEALAQAKLFVAWVRDRLQEEK